MRSRPFRPLLLAGALSICFGLAACGRKGPLEGPPGSNLPRAPKQNAASNLSATPEAPGATTKSPAVVAPKTPFVLDPLL